MVASRQPFPTYCQIFRQSVSSPSLSLPPSLSLSMYTHPLDSGHTHIARPWYGGPRTARVHKLVMSGEIAEVQTPTRRSLSAERGGFSPPGPILPTRPMWQFWVSETLQKRLSNASVTLQKRSTSGLYLLLDVFIHCGSFHGKWARHCGALLARVRVCLAAAMCDG
jgi:hypothetical protein